MTTKYIQDIRKIAKTDEILKHLPKAQASQDKGSIGSNRGVGLADADTMFSPCQVLYNTTDGSYTFADLVDGVAGPRVQDGTYNHCVTVNTITGMRETGTSSPDLLMMLKPDGRFFPNPSQYYYTCDFLLTDFFTFPSEYSAPGYFGFSTAQEAVDKLLARITALDVSTYTSHSVTETLESGTLDSAALVGYNYSETYPVYTVGVQRAGYIGGIGGTADPSYIMQVVFAVPYSYDYTLQAPPIDWPPTTPPIIQYPFANNTIVITPDRSIRNSLAVLGDLAQTPQPNQFSLAIEIAASRLWKPDPDETTAPLKYTNGVSTVTFDFGVSYARKGLVRPGKDGGFVLYETSTGTPINNAYVYRNDRTLAAVVPVSQIDTYVA